MDHMDKAFKNIIDEKLTYNDKMYLESSTLEDEIISYNRKLYKIVENNKINIHNEASFMLKIKQQISNKQLLPVVISFLYDKKYINKFKYENLSTITKGDIAAYILLKTNIEEFLDGIKDIKENTILNDSYEGKKTDNFYKLESLVTSTYEKYNGIHINREQDDYKILYNNDERFIREFIYNNLKLKIINHKIYIKKLAGGREEKSQYLIEVTKKLLGFNQEEFIKEVEHVREFYNMLEKILDEEVDKEYEKIIISFLQNVI